MITMVASIVTYQAPAPATAPKPALARRPHPMRRATATMSAPTTNATSLGKTESSRVSDMSVVIVSGEAWHAGQHQDDACGQHNEGREIGDHGFASTKQKR